MTHCCRDSAVNAIGSVVVVAVDSKGSVHDGVAEDKLVGVAVEADGGVARVERDRCEDNFDLSSCAVVDADPLEVGRVAVASHVVEGEISSVDDVEGVVGVRSSSEEHLALAAFDDVVLRGKLTGDIDLARPSEAGRVTVSEEHAVETIVEVLVVSTSVQNVGHFGEGAAWFQVAQGPVRVPGRI